MLTIKTRVLTLLQHMKQKKYQTPKLGIIIVRQKNQIQIRKKNIDKKNLKN